MPKTAAARWKRLLFPGLVTGLCLCAAYAIVTTGRAAYLENAGEGDGALHWRTASPTALALEADHLAREGQHAAADGMARRALERSTLHAVALRVLAFSTAAKGRVDAAEPLMTRAAWINPRDGQAQDWLFQRALARREYRKAFLRADLLMRRSLAARTPLAFTLADLLGNDRARTALVERLAMDPPWRGTFLTVALRAGADPDVAALFQALRRTPAPVTDEEATPFFRRLVAERRYREAKTWFDALVKTQGKPGALVYDGAFAGSPGPAPLNWQVIAGLGGNARWTWDNDAPIGSLLVRHDGFSSSGPLVRQLILLPPGAYEVAARSRVDDPVADRRFTLQVACATGETLASAPLPGVPGSWTPSHRAFSVPATGCEAQWLQIAPVTVDRREMAEMSIDDIVVRPATAPAGPSGVREQAP